METEGENYSRRPSTHSSLLRSRLASIRQSISEVPVIEVQPGPIEQQEEQGPDGGWGWVVLAASFFCLCVLDGIAYTFGVFIDPLVVEMSEKRSKVSIAGSLLVATYAFAGPVAAKLVTRFGTRKICMFGCLLSCIGLGVASLVNELTTFFIFYSVMSGAGFGCMYIPSIIAVANHFTRLRSLAIGLCLCGAGVGTFVLAPVEQYLTDTYGRKITFIFLSSLCLAACFLAIVMRPVKFVPLPNSGSSDILEQSSETESVEENIGVLETVITCFIDRNLYRHSEFRVFLLILLADVLATFGLFIPYQNLSPVALEAGLTKPQAAFIISSIGISSTVGRLIAGWLCDRPWLHPVTIASISICMVTPTVFLFCFARSYPFFIFLGSSFGFFTGAWIAVMSPVFVRILGLPLLTPAFGVLTGIRGVSSLSGPPLATKAVEYFDDRKIALYTSCLFMALSSLLFVISALWNRRRTLRRPYTQL